MQNITKVLKAFNLLFKSVSHKSIHKKGLPEEIQKTELNTNMHPLLVHNTLIPECTTRLNNAADQVPACSKIMHLSHTTQTYLRKKKIENKLPNICGWVFIVKSVCGNNSADTGQSLDTVLNFYPKFFIIERNVLDNNCVFSNFTHNQKNSTTKQKCRVQPQQW